MAHTGVPDPELLLRHASFVRGLARKLTGDESTADDLVQETWLAALQGRAVRSPRSWLAGILSNLWRERARGEARRRAREETAAREEAVPPPSAMLDAASTGRDLVDLVLHLDEPFRSAVLLRYYENLPPRTIAARLGVPVKTVNSRLSRGLAQLRERWLRRNGGDDRSWLAALAAISRPVVPIGTAPPFGLTGESTGALATTGSASALTTGVLWMSAKTVLVCAALLGGAAWVVLWNLPSADRPASAPDVVAGANGRAPDPARHVEGNALTEAPAAAADARTTLAAAPRAPEATPAAAATPLRTVSGRVLDALALPLGGVDVVLQRNRETAGRATSGAGGRFVVASEHADGLLLADDPRFVTLFFGTVRETTTAEPLVVVAPFRDLAGRVVDAGGSALTGARVSVAPPPGLSGRFDAVFDATERTEWKTSTDEQGRFELSRAPVLDGATLEAVLDGYATARVETPPNEDRGMEIVLVRPTSGERTLAGRVEDPAGAPVGGARVLVGATVTLSEADGRFALALAGDDRSSELVALQRGYLPGRVRASEDAAGGAPRWPDFVVVRLGEPPLAIAGHVVDETGGPVPDVRIAIVEPTRFGTLRDETDAKVEYLLATKAEAGTDAELSDANLRTQETDPEGRFRIEGLLPRAYSLRLVASKSLRAITAGPFEAGSSDVRIVLARGPLHKIAGRIVTREGRPVGGARVGLGGYIDCGVSQHGGEVTTGADGRFAFEGIGANTLTLWVRGEGVVSRVHSVGDVAAAGDLEIAVELRCNFKVDCGAHRDLADAVHVLGADGESMTMQEVSPGGVYTSSSFDLVDGQSKTLGVSCDARTLVLMKGGVEVRRLPLDLVPGRLEVVRP